MVLRLRLYKWLKILDEYSDIRGRGKITRMASPVKEGCPPISYHILSNELLY